MLSNSTVSTTKLLSDAKFFEAYSRWNDETNRYETWNESVARVMSMHRKKYATQLKEHQELNDYFEDAHLAYENKLVLGAQRALQFGGDQILKNNMKLYNCTSTYLDRPRAFGEIFWALLSGSGVGFSVQNHHIAKLPGIAERKKQPKIFVIEDSIEGWADSLLVLLSSYFVGGGTHPEYEGRRVYFDTTQIRQKNAFISGGFKAPGPEPLRKALDKIEYLIQGLVLRGVKKFSPIQAYDIIMHASDAVLAGGVRRSATICLFSPDDEEMMNAKIGNWLSENPQRGRSNNSVVLIRDEVTPEQFGEIMRRTKEFGEPGFAFFDSKEFATNPCFTGDTLVAVADERKAVTIKELANIDEPFLVYSARESILGEEHVSFQRWISEIKPAIAFKTGSRKIITVKLSNGDQLRCTPEHKLALSGCGYVEAQYSLDLRLEDIFGANVFVTEIIDENLTEDVYDLTVTDNHNFYIFTSTDNESNGILVHNCFEVGMYPFDFSTEQSGFQGCNLSEINGGAIHDPETFYSACQSASILGTIQAGYTNFPYMTEATKNIFEREALIGVSVTGWMNSPKILFDEEVLRKGARIVKETNKIVSRLLGINPAARSTVVKPSGTASILLETESGIHGGHSPRHIRNAQMNKDSEVVQLIKATNPYMIEESVWSANGTDYVISFPVIAPKDTIFKKDLLGIKLLEKVKLVQQSWIEEGTDVELCVHPKLRHNVSNTVQVRADQWTDIEKYLYDNRYFFAGVSFIADSGDKDFAQAPFTEILTEQEILEIYGTASFFASGLIVDGLKVFSNLWKAFDVARNSSDATQERLDTQIDWIRRFKKFADQYFDGNFKKAEYCLKDIHLLYRWNKIQTHYKDIDFVNNLTAKKFTDVDTLGAAGCSGGNCELF